MEVLLPDLHTRHHCPWSSLNRARARGFTGVLRRGGPLLRCASYGFRLSENLLQRAQKHFLNLPKKRPLTLEA